MECLFVAPIAAVSEALSSAARIIAVTSRVWVTPFTNTDKWTKIDGQNARSEDNTCATYEICLTTDSSSCRLVQQPGW